MKLKDLREKTKSELQQLLVDSRAELLSVRLKVSGRQETKVRQIRALKRTVAKILTVLNEQPHD